MRKRPLALSRGKHVNYVALLAAVALVLFAALTVGTPLTAALAAVEIYSHYSQDLPPAETLGQVKLGQTTKIYDRNGGLLYEMYDPRGGRRTLIKPEQVTPIVKAAFVATEDATFDTNPGVELQAIARAAWHLAIYHEIAGGGSTITQQLVKNTLLTPDRTWERKIREAILAAEVTRRYPKEDILALYLNTTFFGNQAYGLGAAADTYFGKRVEDLTLSEASLLAGLSQSPANYDPCKYPGDSLARQQTVLGLMQKAEFIDNASAQRAADDMTSYLQTPEFAERCNIGVSRKAPHFVEYVRMELEKRFDAEMLYNGGLQVTTTFDPALEAIAEEEARNQVATLQDKHVTNAAVVILQPNDGQILAMMGSIDFFNKEIDGQVNVTDRLRQPGSSIKPVNYVTALMDGWTPATPIYDLQTKFPNGSKPAYEPVNYDGKFHGLVSMRTALANSLNIPAVKTLYFSSNMTKEPMAMMRLSRRLGISTFIDENGKPYNDFGLTLTLGGGEVRMIELSQAYAAFANSGKVIPTTPFLKIVDGSGKVLYDLNEKDKPHGSCARFSADAPLEVPDAQGTCAKSAPYAYLISSMLSDNKARSMAFGPSSALKLSRPAAVKTGTTNDFRDNWTMGYTPGLLVGVWVGNSDNTQMKNVSGISGAAPIWHNIMERVLASAPTNDFAVPAGVVQTTICIESGLLAPQIIAAKSIS